MFGILGDVKAFEASYILSYNVVQDHEGYPSWSWCGSRSWTAVASYRAALAGGPQCATFRTLLGNPVAVLVVVVVVLECRVVHAGTGAACYRAVLCGGVILIASFHIRCNPGAAFSLEDLEFRVVRAGAAVASDWAARAGGPQCATFRTLLGDPVAVLFPVVVVREVRVVLAGSRSWSWCGSRSWTGATCYRAVLCGGVVLIASFHIRCNPGAAFSLEDLEFRVVHAGTAVASYRAALAGGPQCATFCTLLGDPVAVLFPVVVVREVRVVLAGSRSWSCRGWSWCGSHGWG